MKPSRVFRLSELCVPHGHLTRESQLDTAAGLSWVDPEGAARVRANAIRRVAEDERDEDDSFDLLDCDWSRVTRRKRSV